MTVNRYRMTVLQMTTQIIPFVVVKPVPSLLVIYHLIFNMSNNGIVNSGAETAYLSEAPECTLRF